jgi:hypothetical protein
MSAFVQDFWASLLGAGIPVAILGYLSRNFIEQRLKESFARFEKELRVEARREEVKFETRHPKLVEAATALNTSIQDCLAALAAGPGPQDYALDPQATPEYSFTQAIKRLAGSGMMVVRQLSRQGVILPAEFNDPSVAWVTYWSDLQAAIYELGITRMGPVNALVPGPDERWDTYRKAYRALIDSRHDAFYEVCAPLLAMTTAIVRE